MRGANPALTEAFWKIPSDFAETLNYGQLLLLFFFLPLVQDVRNKYFNSKWHCGALQCCGPGLCPQQPPHFSQQRGMQPEHGPSASTATPGRCQNIAEQGHQQLAGRLFYTFKTHKNIYSSVGSVSC